MIVDETSKLPYEKIGCDFLNFSNNNYLIVADYYSKWFDLIKVASMTAGTVISILKVLFSTHGIPKIVRADNMPFNSIEFNRFAIEYGFSIVTSSPLYPKSNGFIERYVGISKNMLRKCKEEKSDIDLMMLEYRNSPVLDSPYSPCQLLMSRLTRSILPIHSELLIPKIVTGFNDFQDKRNIINRTHYNKSAKEYRYNFEEGQEVVYLKDNVWIPAKIVSFHSTPRSYMIKDRNGNMLRRNSSQLKPSFTSVDVQPRRSVVPLGLDNLDSNVSNTNTNPLDNCDARPKRTIKPPAYLKDYETSL